MPISLTVTRGFTFTGSTALSSANLNAAAQPAVELAENGNITPGYLNIPALINEVGSSLQGANFLQNGGFGGSQWANTSPGVTVDADEITENAWGWFLRATGGTPLYRRATAGPSNNKSLYAAEIVGAASVTLVEFGAWIPAATTQKMLDENVVFSCYVYNSTASSISVTPTLYTAQGEDTIGTVVSILAGSVASCPAGVWTRIELTLDTGAYSDWKNGAWLGFTTEALDSNIKSLQVAQGQLESGSTATDYKRNPPTEDRRVVVPVTEFQGADVLSGSRVLLTLPDGITNRFLGPPPPGLATPVLGWNKAGNYPEWQDATVKLYVFKYTGGRQQVTVPAAVTKMKVHCWGAGGSDEGITKGGLGGYSYAEFTVGAGGHVAGTILSVVVGLGAAGHKGSPYGFGGIGTGPSQPAGGGLSGLFTGTAEILATDTARALVIAGGGGSGGQSSTGTAAAYGGHGNDATRAGGEATMQGKVASSASDLSGGGGGYAGGSQIGRGGKGGTGYVNTSAGAGVWYFGGSSILNCLDYVTYTVPGSGDINYTGTIGQRGNPGMVVIEFTT